MSKAVLFLNSFFSYLFLFAVIVVLVIVAIALGITFRKRKDAKDAAIKVNAEEKNVRNE